MQTSTFVKSVCAVCLVLTAGLTLGAGLLVLGDVDLLCGGQQYGRQTTADFGRLDRELCRYASSAFEPLSSVLPAFFEVLRSARSVWAQP